MSGARQGASGIELTAAINSSSWQHLSVTLNSEEFGPLESIKKPAMRRLVSAMHSYLFQQAAMSSASPAVLSPS